MIWRILAHNRYKRRDKRVHIVFTPQLQRRLQRLQRREVFGGQFSENYGKLALS